MWRLVVNALALVPVVMMLAVIALWISGYSYSYGLSVPIGKTAVTAETERGEISLLTLPKSR